MMISLPLLITGDVISGDGRGGPVLSTPTINLDLSAIPKDLDQGVFAGRAKIADAWLPAAIHYGVRPVFSASLSFEVHVIDVTVSERPKTLTLELLERLRDVQNFPGPSELKAAIDDDIRRTREIVANHPA